MVAIDFDGLCDLFVELNNQNSPAEVHGLLVGQLCAGARPSPSGWLQLVGEQFDLEPLGADAKRALLELLETSVRQLAGAELDFALLIPDAEEIVSARAEALGQWCQGFLAGFGLVPREAGEITDEVTQILEDLAQIALIDHQALDDVDSHELDLAEVSEYVRMAALMLFAQFAPELSGDPDAVAPTTVH